MENNHIDNVIPKKTKNVTNIIGGFSIIVGIILIAVKGFLPEYIDANGILHECFFLIPIGFLCILCGVIILAINYIITVKRRSTK